MKKLLFVRHGQTHMNVDGILSGRTETTLTDVGVQQAKQTGRKLKNQYPGIDLIICSPMQRTYQTAKLIAHEIDYPTGNIRETDSLLERSFGVLEGTLAQDFLDRHEYREFDDVDGSETIEELQKRAQLAMDYLAGLPQDNILVVGHGAFGRAIRRVAQGLPHTHEYQAYTLIDNAAIVELV